MKEKVPGFLSISDAARHSREKGSPRCRQWWGAAVKRGHIKGTLNAGNTVFIPRTEVERTIEKPPVIPKDAYYRKKV